MTNKNTLWILWNLQKETHRAASDILRIREWVRETSGFDGWWEALQFDRAVTYAGRFIENKLNELDSKGHPRHTINELLDDTPVSPQAELAGLMATFGVIQRD